MPDTEQDFEVFCLRVLRRYWALPTLDLYAKRGEKQFGVDIVDMAATPPLRAAQCKHRQVDAEFTVQEVRDEVAKALRFPQKLARYTIVTTAIVGREIHDEVIAINLRHRQASLFEVDVFGWKWVEELLDRDPALHDELYPRSETAALAAQAKHNEQVLGLLQQVLSRDEPAARDGYDQDLDEAKAMLDRGEPEGARALLERLKRTSWRSLSAHQRFRLTTNLACSYMNGSDRERVAALLIEGASYEPHTEKSLANCSVAFELRGDSASAHAAALRAIEQNQTSTRGHSARIRNTPPEVGFDELVATVPPEVKADVEIAIALALRALQHDRHVDAAEWAQRAAATESPNRAYALVLEGWALIEAEIRTLPGFADHRPVLRRPDRIERSVKVLTEAIQTVPSHLPLQKAEALVRRAQALSLLGRTDDAASDVASAEQLAPDEVMVLIAGAESCIARANLDRAERLARKALALGAPRQTTQMLAQVLWERGGPQERLEALELFRSGVGAGRSAVEVEALEHALQALQLLGRGDEGWALLDQLDRGAPSTLGSLRAAHALRLGDQDRARKELDDLRGVDLTSAPTGDRRRIAGALRHLGRHEEALSILRTLADGSALTDDTRALLDASLRIGRHDIFIDVARALREAGVRNHITLRHEYTILSHYAPNEAVRLMLWILEQNPTDREVRLDLSILAHSLGRGDLVCEDLGQLPSASEATPTVGRRVVELLLLCGRPDAATDYAYQLLRRHFGSADAHRGFVVAMLARDEVGYAPPAAVTEGVAVRIQDESTDQLRWLVIDSAPNVSPELSEEPASSSLAKALDGHAAGDRVVVGRGALHDRTVRVVEIVDKMVYRVRDSMSEWQMRFPTEPGFEMVRLADRAGQSPIAGAALAPFFELGRKKREVEEKADALYRGNVLSLHLYATALGADPVEAFGRALARDDIGPRCCLGTTEEWTRALADAQPNRTLVLDLSAALTTDWLELRSVLETWPGDVLVPHALVLALLRHVAQARRFAQSRNDGDALDEGEARARRLDALIDLIRTRCSIPDCVALAAVAPARRDELTRLIGPAAAQAVVLAAQDERVLWTDDAATAQIAREWFGVRVAWTQVLLQGRRQAGALSAIEYSQYSARLLGRGYQVTRFDMATIVQAAELAGWDADRFPLKHALEQMVDRQSAASSRRFVLEAIVALCNAAPLATTRSAIVVALLERLASTAGGRAAVIALDSQIPAAFGLNVIRGFEVRQVLHGWIATREGSDGG